VVHGACDVLVLAAFHPELASLRPVLGDAMEGPIGRVLVSARAAGIGLSAAAAGAATYLRDLRPRVAVAIGTCGAYVGSGLGIGDVVIARRIRLADVGTAQGLSEFPAPMSIALDADASLADAIRLAVESDLPGHEAFFIAAPDTTGGLDLHAAWRAANPDAATELRPVPRPDASGIDSGKAQRLLGWQATRGWRDYLTSAGETPLRQRPVVARQRRRSLGGRAPGCPAE